MAQILKPLRRHPVLAAAQLLVGLDLLTVTLVSDVGAFARGVGVLLAVALTAALLALTISERRVRRGVAALIGGILGFSFGAGIGPVWLTTTGLSIVALVSLAALLAGLLLLAAASWILIRAVPRWWRLAALPVAFVILQFVLIPLAGAAYGTHPPRTPVEAEAPADARLAAFETPDGVTLRAWYTPGRNGATVILLPGSGGAKGSTLAHAAVLQEHGYGTLALDSRGTGDSGGTGNAWGWHGVADVDGALSWLLTEGGVDPARIGILGLSMGGEVAITAAAVDERLAAVVAEGVSARVPADMGYLPGDVTGTIQRWDGQLMWSVAELMTSAVPPIPLSEAVAGAERVPVLLIVGGAEDESAAAPALREAAPSMQVWELPDTPHIQSLAVHADEWEVRVIGFLDVALGAAEPAA